ncbi:hypothetical protein BBP40_010418 [Aspergillus hancockii]|nr:hypothetical protein BBP40_010418 [Aspergillus hancockii]
MILSGIICTVVCLYGAAGLADSDIKFTIYEGENYQQRNLSIAGPNEVCKELPDDWNDAANSVKYPADNPEKSACLFYTSQDCNGKAFTVIQGDTPKIVPFSSYKCYDVYCDPDA